jgi:hypothetical protein
LTTSFRSSWDEHALDKEMHIVSSAVSVERPENCGGKFVSFPHVEHIFLCYVLAHRIRAVWRLGSIFPFGQRAVAKCLGRRSKQKVFEVRHFTQTGFGEIYRARQIRVQDFVRMVVAARYRADRRQMENHFGLHLTDRTLDCELIAQIAKDYFTP